MVHIFGHCKYVIIGDYVSEECGLTVTSKALTFWGKNAEMKDKVPITLKFERIAKLIVCRSDENNIFLIYPTPETIKSIQDKLCLPSEQFKSFSITNPSVSRIFLMTDNGGSNLPDFVNALFTTKVDELTLEEAHDLLKGYSEEVAEVIERSKRSTKVVSEIVPERSRIILQYPPNSRGCITIFTNDFLDLKPGTYLNDAIIDFYLKYFALVHTSEDFQNRIHVFDSFFYRKLISPVVEEGNPDEATSKEDQNYRIYQRVEKWDEKVKLFEKDFIFVPINLHAHWFLAVICYPYLAGQVVHFETGEKIDPQEDKKSPIIQSCILIFDSLGGSHPNVLKSLRNYLYYRYPAEHNGNKVSDFNAKVIPGSYVDVPIQPNYYDCGIFLLQFFESFYKTPIKDFRTPIKGLKTWFEQDVINCKREHLVAVIQSLVTEYQPENLPLPYIDFQNNVISSSV